MDEGPRILAGRYEVGELIGRGGMAEVHIGHDTRLGRTVAIKVLRSDLARDPSFQNRFRREAQAAAALNHPAIVAVYDTGEDVVTEPTGVVAHVPFIVMEYVEGHTVRDILRNGHAAPIEEALEITAGVLSALEYSHHAGIVHRDIKPANVMLTPTGAVKVMDFGIARAVADSAATMTQTQAVIGTAQYLSPEQARGETVDARSDLYSTGCLLFELLTGRPPFTGDSPVSVAYQHVREAAPVPSSIASDVPESLDRIVGKALAKDREVRYQSAAEFRGDLEAVLRGGTVTAPPLGATAATAVVAAGADATQVMTPATQATQAMPPAVPWGATGLDVQQTSYDDEEPRRRTWLLPLLIGIAVLAVGAIVALLIANMNRSSEPETFPIPPVAGKSWAEAEQILTDAGFVPTRAEKASKDVEKDLVIETDPAEGTPAEKATPVTVFVSTGPASVKVPDVSGMSAQAATDELQGKGFKVSADQKTDNTPDFDEGEVSKTDPPAGESVSDGATVTLFVASGNVELPDLKGKKIDEARDILNKLGLSANTTPKPTAEAEVDTVVSQDRAPGLVPQGTVINLEVATAPTSATIPTDLRGQTYEDAVKALDQVGLKNVTRVDEPSNDPVGTVIYTNPSGGEEVELDQLIEIHVSAGNGDGNEGPGGPGNEPSPGG